MSNRNRAGRSLPAVWVLCLAALAASCMQYETRQVVPDSGLPVREKNIIILYQGIAAFQLSGARLADGQLTGLVADVPRLGHASRRYELHLHLSEEYSATLVKGTEIAVPIEMVSSAYVYDLDLEKSIINTSVLSSVLTSAGCAAAGCTFISLASSCPCVYVQDGGQYRFVGEVFPGAVQPALERHDYLRLDPASPAGGEYRLKLANELQEVQHTNLAELLVCDHPPNTTVLADRHGRLHTVREPWAPLTATDSDGSVVLEAVLRRDDRTASPRLKPASDAGLYWLEAAFPRPAGARSAKLLLRARNSFWLDYCYYRLQSNFGSAFAGWQARQEKASSEELLRWRSEQGIALSVYVKRGREWEYADCFDEVGPLAAREQVLVLELAGQSSGELQVKLEAGFLFWEVDFLGVDYSPDLPVKCAALPLLRAENQDSLDITAALQADDGQYYDQGEIGNFATLRFPCPQEAPGLRRTVFLHAKGYYGVRREFSGQPDLALLKGFREPGSFPRYSRELFFEIWR
jgi:hypothetical protein